MDKHVVCGCCAYLRWVNANVDWGAIGFLTLDTLNVDDKLFTVHLHDLANLLPFVVTPHNLQKIKTSEHMWHVLTKWVLCLFLNYVTI